MFWKKPKYDHKVVEKIELVYLTAKGIIFIFPLFLLLCQYLPVFVSEFPKNPMV
jgi:hypothetical protein